MTTIWRVFIRDVKRILAEPKAWIIVIGITITPALYSWLNIAAFWDPYNNTGNLPIAVVNEDRGASSDLTGDINAGQEILAQLQDNDQLGWRFLGPEEADEAVHRGDVYARFVIPPNFSQSLIGIFTGGRDPAVIEYTANEKKSAIAPKITDAGSNALDIRITSAFRDQLGQAVSTVLRESGRDLESRIQDSQNTTTGTLRDLDRQLGDTRENLGNVVDQLGYANKTIEDVKSTLAVTDPALADVSTALGNVQSTMTTVVEDTQAFARAAGEASAQAQEALGVASADTRSALSAASATLKQVGPQVQERAQNLADKIALARASVDAAQQALGPVGEAAVGDKLADLRGKLDLAQKVVDRANGIVSTTGDVANQLDALRGDFDKAVASAQDTAGVLRSTSNDAVSTLTARVTAMSAQAGALAGQVNQARSTLGEVSALVSSLQAQVTSAQDIIRAGSGNLANLQKSAQRSQTDVVALSTALKSGALKDITNLDPSNIGYYLASPVEFQTQPLSPVASYGSSMAPMFINLSLWIGAFMLIVIFRVEVDQEGFEVLALRHAYYGRFLLLVVLAIAQAVIVSVGSLLIGVQTVNAPLFIFTSVLIAINYFSIIYGLASAFGHVGRAIAVLIVIVQIPGASGIYPIELMPGFFRAIYPYLPFTYAIRAMRETVGGFYAGDYVHYMGVSCLMGLAVLVLGLVLRRQLGYFTRLFNEELGRSELIIRENVDILGSGYRLSHIIALMSDRGAYSDALVRRRERFNSSYSVVIRVVVWVGAAGIVALAIVARTTHINKPGLLAIAVVWSLLVVGTLVAMESLKQSLRHASELESLSSDELIEVLDKERDSHSATIYAPETSVPDDENSAKSLVGSGGAGNGSGGAGNDSGGGRHAREGGAHEGD